MTTYRILEKKTDHLGIDEAWLDCGVMHGGSAEQAVRAYVTANGGGGTFVAFPDRSFKPVTLTVEKVAKVTTVSGDGAARV